VFVQSVGANLHTMTHLINSLQKKVVVKLETRQSIFFKHILCKKLLDYS